MSWSEVGNDSTSWTVSASASTSFTERGNSSVTYAAVPSVGTYVVQDYVVNDYILSGEWNAVDNASNTWSAA